MIFKTIYILSVSFMAAVSIGLFIRGYFSSLSPVRGRFGFKESIKKRFSKGKRFYFGGVSVPLLSYQLVRFTALGVWLILMVLLKMTKGLPNFSLQVFLLIFLAVATTPKEKIGRIKLPFLYLTNFFKKARREAANREIYRTISQLINLFTIKGENILGSGYIFSEIIKYTSVTRPVYLKMLSMWNMNMRKEAADYFAAEIGTKEARNLATLFLKLDLISPGELKGQLAHYKNNIKTERITAREKVNERNGNLIYILAIISALVVLVNFLVVVLTDVFASYNLLSF
jgi:hypothetical protein